MRHVLTPGVRVLVDGRLPGEVLNADSHLAYIALDSRVRCTWPTHRVTLEEPA